MPGQTHGRTHKLKIIALTKNNRLMTPTESGCSLSEHITKRFDNEKRFNHKVLCSLLASKPVEKLRKYRIESVLIPREQILGSVLDTSSYKDFKPHLNLKTCFCLRK
ncbi:hypothetical protein RF11_02756 [Thelohanellus kitauei]|uniref:Uncharacterized protein n=1 Tax=Thelohanellus kitauei TaxID=669202 RepID=A0A0C2MDV7_THEKT|nr:hypothetical protein RF11_02756 [Thelohanellus kitauei]